MAAGARSYAQNCGLARSLDLLGERWTLLVVRELARGPKRFRDLLAGLDGVSPNLLSTRLKSLQADGVVQRPQEGEPAYALTTRGEALTAVLEDLALWGYELVDPGDPGARTRAVWAAMSMRARMDRAGRPAPDGLYAFAIGDERFWLRVDGSDSQLRDGAAPYPPDVVVAGELGGFLGVASGAAGAGEAGLRVEGDADRLGALLETFRLPAPTG